MYIYIIIYIYYIILMSDGKKVEKAEILEAVKGKMLTPINCYQPKAEV